MTRVRRRAQHRAEFDNQKWRDYLLDCRGVFRFTGPPPGTSVDAAWDSMREVLLRPYIDEHPGTRPYGWWLCDRPDGEWRACIEGDFLPVDDQKHFIGGEWGIPPHHRLSGQQPPVFESQTDYLRRLKLLTPAETKALQEETKRHG